jgi:septum formation protein
MFSKKLDACNVLLASRSKRRHELLKQMGVKFKVIDQSIDESFPSSLKENNITEYLAKKKINTNYKEIKK